MPPPKGSIRKNASVPRSQDPLGDQTSAEPKTVEKTFRKTSMVLRSMVQSPVSCDGAYHIVFPNSSDIQEQEFFGSQVVQVFCGFVDDCDSSFTVQHLVLHGEVLIPFCCFQRALQGDWKVLEMQFRSCIIERVWRRRWHSSYPKSFTCASL